MFVIELILHQPNKIHLNFEDNMVERVNKLADIIFKNPLEIRNEQGQERITIVLASYQEGQVSIFNNNNHSNNNICLDEKGC